MAMTYVKLQHPVSGRWWDRRVKSSFKDVRSSISRVLNSHNGEFELGNEVFHANLLRQMVITVKLLEESE